MPPQDSQVPQQPIEPPLPQTSPIHSQDTSLLIKKIQNAGQSVFLLGCFLAFIGIVASLGLGSLESNARIKAVLYLLMVVVAGVYWIIAGLQIKKNSANAKAALSTIRIVLITSVVVSAISIVKSILSANIGVGDFAIILTLYLLLAQSRIKQLSGQ